MDILSYPYLLILIGQLGIGPYFILVPVRPFDILRETSGVAVHDSGQWLSHVPQREATSQDYCYVDYVFHNCFLLTKLIPGFY